jgi:hypothetical protein
VVVDDQRYLTANGIQHLKDVGAVPMPTKVKVLNLSLGDLLTKGSIRNPKASAEWVNRSLKYSYSCSERVFSCDQNRCQSGLSAVRVKACPAPSLDLFLWKMDRKRGHNWGTFS